MQGQAKWLVSGLFTAVLLLLWAGTVMQVDAQSVPGHLKIVFTSTRDYSCPPDPVCELDEKYGELYIMNRNGSDQTRITNDQVPELGAVWSPDGTKIAFHSPINGVPQIFLINPDGTGQTQLTNIAVGAQFPDWSPDGKKIAFQSNKRPRDIFILSSMDGTVTNLTSGVYLDSTTTLADDLRPAWSPNVSNPQIAFQSNRDGNDEIYVMNADGSYPIRLTYNPAQDQAPDWSSDGTQIVFQSNRDGHFEIYVMNAGGESTGLNRLTNTDCSTCTTQPRNLDPAWSPDGEKIAFDSDRDFVAKGIRQVFVMNADGTNQKSLTSLPGENGHAGWGWEADVEP